MSNIQGILKNKEACPSFIGTVFDRSLNNREWFGEGWEPLPDLQGGFRGGCVPSDGSV